MIVWVHLPSTRARAGLGCNWRRLACRCGGFVQPSPPCQVPELRAGGPRKPGALAGAHTRGKRQGPILGMSRVASPAWLDLALLRLPWSRHCLWVGPSVPPGKCTSPGVGGGGGNLDTQRPPRGGRFTWSSRARSLAAGNTAGWTASRSHSVQPELLAALAPRCLPTSAGLPLLRGTPALGFPHLHLSRALRKLTGGIFCHTGLGPWSQVVAPSSPVPGLVSPLALQGARRHQ